MKTTCPKCQHAYVVRTPRLPGTYVTPRKTAAAQANGAKGGRPAKWDDAAFLEFFPKGKGWPLFTIREEAMLVLKCSRSAFNHHAKRLLSHGWIETDSIIDHGALWRRTKKH